MKKLAQLAVAERKQVKTPTLSKMQSVKLQSQAIGEMNINSRPRITKFALLNPMMVQSYVKGYEGCNELSFECPGCGRTIAIHCTTGPNDPKKAIWHYEFKVGVFDWSAVTISPSIQNHPVPRYQPQCNEHFSITNGEVV